MTKCPTCQQDVKADRSSQDHRRFFGLIAAAFHHWPESHEFTPDNPESLRAWLLCKAGYCERTSIDCEWADNAAAPGYAKLVAIACEATMRASKGQGFIRVHGDRIVVFSPKSIAWDKIGQKAFNEVRDAVSAVIEQELGIGADTLLKEHEAAA